MSPEQRAGRPVDARTDQFSFCIALREALTGSRLADPALEPVSARTWPAPKWLVPILERALEVSPDRRYPSMEALLAALRRSRRPWWLRWLVRTRSPR